MNIDLIFNLILLVMMICGGVYIDGVLRSEKSSHCRKCGGRPYFGNPGAKPPAQPVRWHVGRF